MKIPLFDIDGTLFKSGIKIHLNAFDYAFKTVYEINASESEIDTRGMTDKEIVTKVLSLHGLNKDQITKKYNLMRNKMSHYFNRNCKPNDYIPLPGVRDLLISLREKNIPIGILTGNIKEIAFKKLRSSKIERFFDFGAFGDITDKRLNLVKIAKEDAEKKFNKKFDLDDFVIIGDTPRDIKCARDANISVISVSSGDFSFKTLEESNPNLIVHSLEEKNKIINFLLR